MAASVGVVLAFGRRDVSWLEVAPEVLAQLIAIIALIVLIRRRVERHRRFKRLSESVSDAARMALRDTRERIAELKAIAGIASVIITVVVVGIYQLHRSGKMDAQAVAGFAMVTGAIVLVNVVGWGLHLRGSLAPRRQRLEAIVSALGDPQ